MVLLNYFCVNFRILKQLLSFYFLFSVSFVYNQTFQAGFSWLTTSPVFSAVSPNYSIGNCSDVTYTINSSEDFRMVNNGFPYNNNALFFPSNINNTAAFVDMSITFNQPISNLRIRFVDLDENVNGYTEPEESVSLISPIPSSVNSLSGAINNVFLTGATVSPFDNNSNFNNNDAAGWVNWTGLLSSVNFRYNRPGALYALIIDSISFDCPSSGCNAVANLGSDLTICNNQQTLIDASNSVGNSFLWNNGSTGSTLSVNSTGTYWVTVSDGICNDTDTINVINEIFQPNLLDDSLFICPDSEVLLELNIDNTSTYSWSNGSSGNTINVTEPGVYWVDVTNGQCSFADTITISEKVLNLNSLPIYDTLCENGSILLDAFDNNVSSYLWNTGETTPSILITQAGIYWVERMVDGCIIVENTEVIEFELINQEYSIEKCTGESLLLQSSLTSNLNNIWSNGSISNSIIVSNSGVYSVSTVNQCGTNSETYNVSFANCNCDVYVPNTFTPDEDEFNQLFEIKTECDLVDFHFEVFNRWGEIVFESFDKNGKWDGRYGAQLIVQDGVYTYKLTYQNSQKPDTIILTGHISVLK